MWCLRRHRERAAIGPLVIACWRRSWGKGSSYSTWYDSEPVKEIYVRTILDSSCLQYSRVGFREANWCCACWLLPEQRTGKAKDGEGTGRKQWKWLHSTIAQELACLARTRALVKLGAGTVSYLLSGIPQCFKYKTYLRNPPPLPFSVRHRYSLGFSELSPSNGWCKAIISASHLSATLQVFVNQ